MTDDWSLGDQEDSAPSIGIRQEDRLSRFESGSQFSFGYLGFEMMDALSSWK